MSVLALGRAGPALHRWFGLPAERIGCLLHFMALAVTLAAAKVILSTIGVAMFLAKEGPAELPLFYVLLALVAILFSVAFSLVVDRLPRIRLGQIAFLGSLLGVAALRVPIELDLPGAYHALLASAHIYEIVLDIVFWVVVAAFLDTVELKRGTPFLYMALAAGGALGGLLMSGLSPIARSEDLLLILPLLGMIAAAQFGFAGRRLRELHDPHRSEGEAGGMAESLRVLPRLAARYPLILLIALNALVLTVLYGLSEYLVFTVYADAFADEAELTQFLAVVFALIQVLEFGLLYAVSRPLLERAGPLVRNLVFPLTSVASLIALAAGQRLPAAIVAHLNAEAVSNAIFQPVNNTNYVALPVRFHGRVRTLADGIFYPSGLALAGVMLLSLQDRLAFLEVNFVAIVFALLFLALNVGVGMIFLPTMVRNLRAGVVDLGAASPRPKHLPAEWTARVGELLRSVDPEARSIGLAVARHLEVTSLLPELGRLASGADRATRHMIADLLRRVPATEARPLIEELLDRPDVPSRLLGLRATLVRGEALTGPRRERLRQASERSVAALASLATKSLDPVLPDCRDPEVSAEIIDVIGQSARADLIEPLITLAGVAPVEQQRRCLTALLGMSARAAAPAAELARRLADHGDPRVRAEAVRLLGRLPGTPGALAALAQALEDPRRIVRQRAAEALAAHGDVAIGIAIAKLSAPRSGVVEAAFWTLGRIGTPRAREALTRLLGRLAREAARNLDWLRSLPRGPDRRAWAALESALEDHNRRIANLILNVLAALGQERAVAELRRALGARDRRTRANALEGLASLPQRRLIQPILPLFDGPDVGRPDGRTQDGDPVPGSVEPGGLLSAAALAKDPWIRAGAAVTARALRSRHGIVDGRPAAPTVGEGAASRRPPATPLESDMEQILSLKRVPLFRHLPLDTLLAVSRVLERRHYLDGEVIVEAGAPSEHLWVLDAGAVDRFRPTGVERLRAPACFGELALIDEQPRLPRIRAAEDCEILCLHRVIFHDLVQDHPELLLELCKLLAQQLRRVEGAS